MVRAALTKAVVDGLRPGETIWDARQAGLGVRCQLKAKSYFVKYSINGRQRTYTIGRTDKVAIEAARKAAKRVADLVANGTDPATVKAASRVAKKAQTETMVSTLAETFIARMKKRGEWKPRTAAEVARIFKVYVSPAIGQKPIAAVRRSDIAQLLDKIEDENGPVMADRVLAWVRRLFSWWAAQDDDFKTPIVKGMARIKKPALRKRTRTLTDDEIRAIWKACDEAKPAIFGQLIRFLFLTAQRKQDCGGMIRPEVDGDLWTIPRARYKTPMLKGHAVPLTDEAAALLAALPHLGPYYFTTSGTVPFGGFSKSKQELDRVSGVTGWTIHDIRRTAKTLMQRAGVQAGISERVLGHVIPGVEGVYDQHPYLDEKKAALTKLAGLLSLILKSPGSKVVELAQLRA